MSRNMLHAVLQMPIALWGKRQLDCEQRHSRYLEASTIIQEQDRLIESLKDQILDLKSPQKDKPQPKGS